MSWWVWALIAWGTTASAAVLWLGVERSVYVERRETSWVEDDAAAAEPARAAPVRATLQLHRRLAALLSR